MYTDVMKVKPDLDKPAAKKMENDLNKRFSNVAKRFGAGLKNAFKFTGVLAVGSAIITKILNPLQEAEGVLDRVLNRGATATDTAEDLGTDPGKFLRLEAMAQMKGVDSNTLRDLLSRFQGALAREREGAKRGDDPGYLREFVNEKDTAEAFLLFMRSLQKADKDRQIIIQNEIFGERQRSRSAAFFNEPDYGALLSRLPSDEILREAARRTNEIDGQRHILNAVREIEVFVNQSKAVNQDTVRVLDQSYRETAARETEQLRQFNELKNMKNSFDEMANEFRKLATDFINDTGPQLVESVRDLSEGIRVLSPYVKNAAEKSFGAFDKVLEWGAKQTVQHENLFRWFLNNSAVYQYFKKD